MIPQFMGVPRAQRRAMLRKLERDNQDFPAQLVDLPSDFWPAVAVKQDHMFRVLRSRRFIMQVFRLENDVVRLSVNRTEVDPVTYKWAEGITWEELQRLKGEAGYGDREAVEIYPPAGHEVNVANMRHLWVLPERLPFSWGR